MNGSISSTSSTTLHSASRAHVNWQTAAALASKRADAADGAVSFSVLSDALTYAEYGSVSTASLGMLASTTTTWVDPFVLDTSYSTVGTVLDYVV